MIAGIDFGARFSGGTAVCFDADTRLCVWRAKRGQDADVFLEDFMRRCKPAAVYIDAPLSLPAAYFDRGGDFFYRVCDRQLGAMSPMFLGGLTARAMSFKDRWSAVTVLEVYPRAAARALAVEGIGGYRESTPGDYVARLTAALPLPLKSRVTFWHEVDAVLAWWSGWRHTHGRATCFGDGEEGQIWV